MDCTLKKLNKMLHYALEASGSGARLCTELQLTQPTCSSTPRPVLGNISNGISRIRLDSPHSTQHHHNHNPYLIPTHKHYNNGTTRSPQARRRLLRLRLPPRHRHHRPCQPIRPCNTLRDARPSPQLRSKLRPMFRLPQPDARYLKHAVLAKREYTGVGATFGATCY